MKIKLYATLIGAAVLILAAAWPQAADEAEIIRRVVAAQNSVYYQGLLVTTRRAGNGREEEVARAWFGPHGQQAMEIVTPTWRSGELLIVDGKYRWLIYLDCDAILRLPYGAPDQRYAAKGVELIGTEQLGDRPTLVLRWKTAQVERTIWIDAEQYVPLKQEDKGDRGELTLTRELKDVQFPASPPADRFTYAPEPGLTLYTSEPAFNQAVSLRHIQRGLDFRLRQPAFLPTGITFQRALLRDLPQLTVAQLQYGDGQGKQGLSLFEYPSGRILVPPDRLFKTEVRPGTRLSVIRWRSGEIEFVLVGNFDLTVLQAVAKSMK